MKTLKRLPLMLILASFVFMLAGCSYGSTIDTKMVMNADGSGARYMNVAISDSTFSEYVSGTTEDLDNLIASYCPDEMKWEHTNEDGADFYNFTIEYSNIEDYENKVKAILATDEDMTDITVSNSVWANGVYVSENFESTDLLSWLAEAMVNEEMLSASNVNHMFQNGSTSFEYNGSEYDSYSSYITVDEMSYVQINNVDILTEILDGDLFNRSYVFEIQKSDYLGNKNAIDEYMETITPETATGNWTEKDSTYVYAIEAANVTASDISNLDNLIYGTEGESFYVVDDECNYSPFSFEEYFYETINLSNYIVDGCTATNVNVGLKQSDFWDNHKLASIDYMLTDVVEGYEDYDLVDNFRCSDSQDYETGFITQILNPVANVDIKMKKNLFDWERSVAFDFERDLTEEQKNTIIERVNLMLTDANLVGVTTDATAETETTETEVTQIEASEATEVEEVAENDVNPYACLVTTSFTDDGEGTLTFTITQKGTLEEIEANCKLFDANASMEYAKDKTFSKIRKYQTYMEKVDYSAFLVYAQDYLTLNSVVDMNGSEELNQCYQTGCVTNISYVSKFTDVWAVLFWLLVVTAIGNVAYWTYKQGYLNVVLGKAKSTKLPKIEKVSTPKFCGKCGVKLEEDGAKFCPVCGEKCA